MFNLPKLFKMLKILLAESHLVVREKIKALLAGQTLVKVVLETPTLKIFLEAIPDVAVDVILSGWYNVTKDGLDWLKDAKKYRPEIPVILLTMRTNDESIRKAFLVGVSGYLLSNVGVEELIFAMKHVSKGEIYLSSQLSLELINRIPVESEDMGTIKDALFSKNEIKLLQALGDGLSNKAIADQFFLSKRSIESQRAALIKKSGVRNTASLIRFACVNRLIS